MRGKYSSNPFFMKFPQINQIYFQGSESTEPEDLIKLFNKAESKSKSIKKKFQNKEDIPIIMILFDELGLAERSPSNPLKVLHEKLDDKGKDEGVSFVGISNYSLDAAKINRALVLSVPDLDESLDVLKDTAENIVVSISEKIKNDKIFQIISKTYFEYKRIINVIKELIVYKEYINEKKLEKDNIQEKELQEELGSVPETNTSGSKESSIIKGEEKNEENLKKLGNTSREEIRGLESIKQEKYFKDLMKKEKKIRKDFHGNRDFYNIIRGIAIQLKSGDMIDKDKVPIIIQYIERNFGGINYEIDIDFNSALEDKKDDIKLIKEFLLVNKGDKYLSSVSLFKQLYNRECDEDKISNLKIDKSELNKYELNKCINDNINDNYSRYLLLEIEQSLTTLICQNIKLQNPRKAEKIEFYEGSPFVDDNSKEYRFKIVNKIQEDAKEDKLIIIENLNQIHPFLFDLYNKNYIIKNNKKFVRICLENLEEDLTEVSEKFRVIIFVDKRFVDKCDLAFLNRLEKMNLSFDKLLDKDLETISNEVIDEMNLKEAIRKCKNINFSLKDLLINCEDEEIQALIYYFQKELKKNDYEDDEEQNKNKITERNIKKAEETEEIKKKVFNKIYKILPQDIICILQKGNKLREYYNRPENDIFFNFKEYINEKKNKEFKISIIYTFTSIANNIDGLNKGMSFMASQIRSEEGLRRLIDEIKEKNEKNKIKKEYIISIDFEQSNSRKIKFISNFILSNYKNDKYNYIFIIHINRNINKNNSENIRNDKKARRNEKIYGEKVYSLPDINPDINQVFIDNLNWNNTINLKYLLDIKDIKSLVAKLDKKLNFDEEFAKIFKITLSKELIDKSMEEDIINDYIKHLENYMDDDFRNHIMETAYKLIEKNGDEDTNCEKIINKIYKNNYINKYTIDVGTCIIDYIKNKIFNIYTKKVLLILEDNNILTTLYKIERNEFKDIRIDKSSINEIVFRYLDKISEDKDEIKIDPKFLFNYNVPGLYNFFEIFSKYINKNIVPAYYNNEKKLRDALIFNIRNKDKFQENEESLIENTNKYINNNKFIKDILEKVSHDLIFCDYVTYYLQKKSEIKDFYKDDIYHKLIELLLKLRFKKETKENNMNDLLTKIIWIESNVNYILNILKIFDCSLDILYQSKNNLYKMIEDLIFRSEKKIRYITNKERNPEHTKEVNECYYILLASICYCITSEDIVLSLSKNDKNNKNIEVFQYYYKIIEINKILENLDNDLYLFLNERYIIDELIKVIELFTKKNVNIDKINEIKNLLRKNAEIIQKYNDDETLLIDGLIVNLDSIYKTIIKDENIKNDIDYYDKLRYIFYKEILKISNIEYRFEILKKILESNEMIKKSIDIFQVLLKKYVRIDFRIIRNVLYSGEDCIIKLLNKLITKNFVLEETLLYFFEKNSFYYLENIINSEIEIEVTNEKKVKEKKKLIVKLDNIPLDIFKNCYDFLYVYIFKQKELNSQKSIEICKLFCISYIKSYIHIFIKSFEEKENLKFQDADKIINVINGNNPIYKMIRIYIYKILYNNFGVEVFIEERMIDKYKLKKYAGFTEFIQIKQLNDMYKIEYSIRTIKDEKFNEAKIKIEKYKSNNCFSKKLDLDDFDLEEFGIDNFFIVSYNLILSNLQMYNQDLDYNTDFFINICQPLFSNDDDYDDYKLLYKAIQLFYDPKQYASVKRNFNFNSKNIKAILFGYRYCLNELFNKKKNGIFYPLYDDDHLEYLKNQFYPGNDTKSNKVYSSIVEHFKKKPNEGCYVCLCSEGYYHSVKSGFPGENELDKSCPKCLEKIGTIKNNIIVEFFWQKLSIVNRPNYYRIFKSKQEIKNIEQNAELKKKLKEIRYMTIDEYKEKYVINEDNIKKGVFIYSDKNDINYFKNDKKIVRNLSQITFRILNFILYSHLFFARLVTGKNEDFKEYLPGRMGWAETLYECWKCLENQLLKENIDSIEKFLSYSFVDLFKLLNKEHKIDDYESLIEIEDNLELEILKIIKNYKEYIKDTYKNNMINKKKIEDKNSFISLLKETYTYREYSNEEYPFYQYFYFTNYLDQKYINEKLSHLDKTNYPVLVKYIETKNNNGCSLKNLNLFNSVLNLISENYLNKISREYAENTKLKNEKKFYDENKLLINEFISFVNKTKNENLSIDNPLSDFLLVGNKFSEIYINIYNEFAKKQNEELEELLDNKINNGIFDANCKNRINIQQIDKKEIFTLTFPEGILFTDILFNSSYRKIIDSDIKSNYPYKEFEINYNKIEDYMTELLLKNKKLLNCDITEFMYSDEVFTNQVSDLMSSFWKNINYDIDIHDKVAIYKFYKDFDNDVSICKDIINDFRTLLKFNIENNDKVKDENEKNNISITEETKIYEIIKNSKDGTFSDNFIKMFENNEFLIFGKTCEIFLYYLKLIFIIVKNELKDCQNEISEETKKSLEKYFKTETEHLISKKDFAIAIRLFSTLILFFEDNSNREKKIKMNRNNIVNYLKVSDLWESNIYEDNNFSKNLNELKLLNIKINQIIPIYEILGNEDIPKNFCEDVENQIENETDKNHNDGIEINESYDQFEVGNIEENYDTLNISNRY